MRWYRASYAIGFPISLVNMVLAEIAPFPVIETSSVTRANAKCNEGELHSRYACVPLDWWHSWRSLSSNFWVIIFKQQPCLAQTSQRPRPLPPFPRKAHVPLHEGERIRRSCCSLSHESALHCAWDCHVNVITFLSSLKQDSRTWAQIKSKGVPKNANARHVCITCHTPWASQWVMHYFISGSHSPAVISLHSFFCVFLMTHCRELIGSRVSVSTVWRPGKHISSKYQ